MSLPRKKVSLLSQASGFLLPTTILLLLVGPIGHSTVSGQYLNSPCPEVFSYRLDPNSNQAFGYVELHGLRIGTTVKLIIDLSYNVEVGKQNLGSITLVKSNEQTFRDIYNNQPAQYRVSFPFQNIVPRVLSITVNGQTICTGQAATGRMVTTVKLEHTLYTKVNGNGNDFNQILPYQPTYQPPAQQRPTQTTPAPFVYQPPMPEYSPQRPFGQRPFAQRPPVQEQPRPQQTSRPPQPVTVPPQPPTTNAEITCGSVAPLGTRLSINGVRSSKGQFPWAVPIFNVAGVSKPQYICGSSLIGPTHILTAAHCMYFPDGTLRQADQLAVVPGMFNIDNFSDDENQEREVTTIHVHEEYLHEDILVTDSDIAVLVLRQAVTYNDLVRPICLWSGSDNLEQIIGSKGFVSGWGITDTGDAKYPSYVTASVIEKRQCSLQLGRLFSSTSRTFCADGHGAVPCNGDSGSGLALKRGTRYYLRGIVSTGQHDPVTLLCDTQKYVVYTDVAPFRFWLSRIMKS
ncbi:serine protease gd-like [Anopheles bellator]|uniref:serine protease gd-like n=1 Tax=Anopheles bellator TaxID=139047 RepID=UPI0026495F0B|nr:serine protease gd-like [Anopheles bellator]